MTPTRNAKRNPKAEPNRKSRLSPAHGSGGAIECEESVILKIRLRRDAGRKKYGTSMERTDLTKLEWLRHAQEEAMDFAIYLEKLIQAEQQPNYQAQARRSNP